MELIRLLPCTLKFAIKFPDAAADSGGRTLEVGSDDGVLANTLETIDLFYF